MHRYIPSTPQQQQREMLSEIGAKDVSDLFASVPEDVRLDRALDLPAAMAEMDVEKRLRGLAAQNAGTDDHICFLGAGAYDHFIPAVVDTMLQRQEFYTAYTPYQPEISQGTLQAIFEYQTMICMLTGMDVANASMYDGASALAEAALMACHATGRSDVLVAKSVHPESRAVLRTYARYQDIGIQEFGYLNGQIDVSDLGNRLSDNTAAVVIQTPNFFGVIEDLRDAEKLAHENGALLIVSCDPIAMAVLKAPGEMGADIVVGEGQALGSPMSFGGPQLGFFAATDKLLRKMPGRIAGQTVDKEGRRGFVLTVQTREQHIRREKATSNICSNQALSALAAAIYLTAMGKQGLRNVATQCMSKAQYAYTKLLDTGMFEPVFDAPFFKEFAVRCKGDIGKLNAKLMDDGIIGGYDAGRADEDLHGVWLLAVTEKRTKAEIDMLAEKVVAL